MGYRVKAPRGKSPCGNCRGKGWRLERTGPGDRPERVRCTVCKGSGWERNA